MAEETITEQEQKGKPGPKPKQQPQSTPQSKPNDRNRNGFYVCINGRWDYFSRFAIEVAMNSDKDKVEFPSYTTFTSKVQNKPYRGR